MKASDVSPARSTRSPMTSRIPSWERSGGSRLDGPRDASVSVRAAVRATAIAAGWWRALISTTLKIENATRIIADVASASRRGTRDGCDVTERVARISSRSPAGATSREASTSMRPRHPTETSRQHSSHPSRCASKRRRSRRRISPETYAAALSSGSWWRRPIMVPTLSPGVRGARRARAGRDEASTGPCRAGSPWRPRLRPWRARRYRRA